MRARSHLGILTPFPLGCLHVILPVITLIGNLSLSASFVLDILKDSSLTPLLQKAIMESQITDHVYDNNLHEVMESV